MYSSRRRSQAIVGLMFLIATELGHAQPLVRTATQYSRDLDQRLVQVREDTGTLFEHTFNVAGDLLRRRVTVPLSIRPPGPIVGTEGVLLRWNIDFVEPGPGVQHVAEFFLADGTRIAGEVRELDGGGVASGSFRFVDDGEYQVKVRVRNARGITAVAFFGVQIENADPVVGPAQDLEVAEGEEFAAGPLPFQDSGTSDVHDALIDWGDGTIAPGVVDAEQRVISARYRYRDEGLYRVTVVVDDDEASRKVKTSPNKFFFFISSFTF